MHQNQLTVSIPFCLQNLMHTCVCSGINDLNGMLWATYCTPLSLSFLICRLERTIHILMGSCSYSSTMLAHEHREPTHWRLWICTRKDEKEKRQDHISEQQNPLRQLQAVCRTFSLKITVSMGSFLTAKENQEIFPSPSPPPHLLPCLHLLIPLPLS